MVRSLQAYVTLQAERRPQATALVDGDERVTYEALANANGKVDRVALRALFAEEMADDPA